MAFLTKEKPFWPKPFQPKPFRDLSLATMLVLKQVSVINDLKATKECRHKWPSSGKRKDTQFCFSGKD